MSNMKQNEKSTPPIIFFDGICNLCSGVVMFVLKNEPKHQFQFAALQSPFAQSVLAKYTLPTTHFNSFILLQNNKVYTKSTAALKVAAALKFPFNLLTVGWIIPTFIRDSIYQYIAANRYRWFGKKTACFLPDKKWENRFLR